MNTDPSLVTITKRAHQELLFERRVLDMVAGENPALFKFCSDLAAIPMIGEDPDDTVPDRVRARLLGRPDNRPPEAA